MTIRQSCKLALILVLLAPSLHAATAIDKSQGDKDTEVVLFGSYEGARPLHVEQERYLAFGRSIFNYYGDKQFKALAQLLINKKKGLFTKETNYASLLMGELYVDYGLPKPAEAIFSRLLKEDILSQTRAETWLNKAELHYHLGEFDKAKDILESDKVKALSPEKAAQRSLVLANVLIASKDFEKAQSVLQHIPPNSPDRIYADYNIAVAMIRDNQLEEGLELLAEVYNRKAPTTTSTTPTQKKQAKPSQKDSQSSTDALSISNKTEAVKDRAALTAGLVNVKAKHYKDALVALSHVRSEGPFSTDAMLVMGLAFYKSGQPQKALPLWLTLVNRNSSNASVQEALLLAPQAYEKLGALPQALSGYQFAVRTYRDELRKVQVAIQHIQDGSWLKTLLPTADQVRQHPDPMSTVSAVQHEIGPGTLYLYRLFASRSFAHYFKEYQQIRRLGMLLDNWDKELGVLEATYHQQQRLLAQRLPTIRRAVASVNRQQQTLAQRIQQLVIPRRLSVNHIENIASYPQWIMWQSVQRLENSPLKHSARLRHIRGLLLWDIAHDAQTNREQQQQNRAKLATESQQLSTRIAAINQLVEDANAHIHTHLGNKFAAKQKRIDSLQQMDAATLTSLQNVMEAKATKALTLKYGSLIQKLANANLAVARLQDNSVSKQDGTQ